MSNSEQEKKADDEKLTKYELRDPDVRLMLQVRDGNAGAFEELVNRYRSRLIGVMEHLVQGLDQAEDLAQEVFMRVYRARETYSPDAKFSTWLFTIANNVASNALRKHSKRKEVHLNVGSSGQMPAQTMENMVKEASGLMPTRQLDKSELSEIVRMAIQSLNERQRMALLLSKFENMSYIDIATTMDLSVQAVKSLLSRARGKLKEILEPYVSSGVPPASSDSDSDVPGPTMETVND